MRMCEQRMLLSSKGVGKISSNNSLLHSNDAQCFSPFPSSFHPIGLPCSSVGQVPVDLVHYHQLKRSSSKRVPFDKTPSQGSYLTPPHLYDQGAINIHISSDKQRALNILSRDLKKSTYGANWPADVINQLGWIAYMDKIAPRSRFEESLPGKHIIVEAISQLCMMAVLKSSIYMANFMGSNRMSLKNERAACKGYSTTTRECSSVPSQVYHRDFVLHLRQLLDMSGESPLRPRAQNIQKKRYLSETEQRWAIGKKL